MRFEYAISVGDPRSVMAEVIQVRSTGSSHMTRADVLGALGMVQKREGIGLALVMAKYTKDPGERNKAISGVMRECVAMASRYIGPLKHKGQAQALRVLAMVAVDIYCRTPDTPGAACQCKGRGVQRDLKLSSQNGKQVEKLCPRCHGTGLRPITGTRVRRAIEAIIGTLTRTEWERQWFPLYQSLLAWCHVQQSEVERAYRKVTVGG